MGHDCAPGDLAPARPAFEVPAAPVLYERRPAAAIGALFALSMTAFCFVCTENLPIGLLPVISASLRASVPAVGLLVTVYAGVVVVASAPLTLLTKHVPRRRLLAVLLACFVVTSLASAAAGSYWVLLTTRMVTATAQALFWAIVMVAAVGLFPPSARSKALVGVVAGSSVAIVAGVPFGTWLGQQGGWRLPFVVLSAVGALDLAIVATLVPSAKPAESHAAAGSHPDRRRYRLLVASTVLVVTGSDTAYTYVAPFMTRVARLPAHDVAAVLVGVGAAGAVGVMAAGALFDRRRRLVTIGPVALVAGSLLGLYLAGTAEVAAIAFEAAASCGLGAFVVANQHRVLIVAPGSTDVANAWAGASFNVGIGGGALIGGVVVATMGTRATAIVGALLAAAAAAVLVGEHMAFDRWVPSPSLADSPGGQRRPSGPS
jgi:DHA1 family inner membrane transport protein